MNITNVEQNAGILVNQCSIFEHVHFIESHLDAVTFVKTNEFFWSQLWGTYLDSKRAVYVVRNSHPRSEVVQRRKLVKISEFHFWPALSISAIRTSALVRTRNSTLC